MSGWTPGPWEWRSVNLNDGKTDGSVISLTNPGGAKCVCKPPQFWVTEQWQADANLIAAAPDLAVVAESALRYAEDQGNDFLARVARAALEKARGES